jgi:hypothetical membrane protein
MQKIAGALFFTAGAVLVMGILTAEVFYPPGYSISLNMISNLGATPPPRSTIHEPSAQIFDISLVIAGLAVAIGSLVTMKTLTNRFFSGALLAMGLGTLGVGLFPAYHPYAHPFVALIAFLSAGTAAILSHKFVSSPFNIISVILGAITLSILLLGLLLPHLLVPILGPGGTERWVAYPSILWLIGFGGYLMHDVSPKK